jgi:uncharacterized membrane protein
VHRAAAILAVVAAAAVWVAALVAAPSAATRSGTIARWSSAFLYTGGALICHQKPERSFHRDGAPLPVCARCFGLYAGALAGALLWGAVARLARTPSTIARRWAASGTTRRALLLSALPTLVSVITAWLGWWDGNNVLRALLAVPLGAVVGSLVTAVAAGDLR